MVRLFRTKNKENTDIVQSTTRTHYSVTDEEIKNYADGANGNLKVMHFTHTDIAGKVCSVIGQRTFANIETKYCSNRDVDDIINTFILIDRKFSDYNLILITDVSLSEGTLVNLQKVQEFTNGAVKVQYYNHQECNIDYSNTYSWATIEPEYCDTKQDSASIFYRYMMQEYSLVGDDWLGTLVEKSRRYTKWEWKTLEDEVPNSLSMLCHDAGHKFFVKKLIKKHIANSQLLDEEDFDKLDYLEQKYQQYKESKINEVILSRIGNAKVGFVLAEQHIDRLGYDIPNHYKNLDSVVLVNSLVALNIRNSQDALVNANEIAKVFGGNGEKKAAGAAIPVDIREEMIRHLINISQERFKKIKK